MKRLFALFLALALLPFGLARGEAAAPAERVEKIIDGIIACQLQNAGADDVQAWIDDGLSQTAGKGTEWLVFGLSRQGRYDFSAYYAALLDTAQNGGVLSAATRQKYALALLAAGGSNDFVEQTMQETIGAQGIMTWVYGLHLLNNGCTGSVTAEQAVEELLRLQLADGGWALRGEAADVDVTAMTIQALAPHAHDEQVAAAVERAVEVLSKRQLETGDFNSYGAPNPESTAQVMIALAALGTDVLKDERFIKNGDNLLDVIEKYRLEDGSFSHTLGGKTNANANQQVLMAMVAWQRMMDGRSGLYMLDAEQTETRRMQTRVDGNAIAALAVAAVVLIVCIVLFAAGKRSIKNYVAVLVLGCAAAAFVLTTEFKSADDYYSGQTVVKSDPVGQVTMSISCEKALGHTSLSLPMDGVILAKTPFAIAQGDTVYTILTETAQTYGIRLDISGPQGMKYVTGVEHLYEYSCGDLSGWVYLVNGERASIGCDQYVLEDGDVIEWHYTLEMGADL